MNETQVATKFLAWLVGVVVILGLVGSLKKLTYHMAESAVEAQEHPMSWGQFSKKLWSKP